MSRNAEPTRHAKRHFLTGCWSLLLVMAMTTVPVSAWAKTTDRNQPMDIDAGHQAGTLSGDGTTTLSGGVHVIQGSLDIQSSSARITLTKQDPERAVFTGSPVVLKQTLDDGTPMTARANSVDYNLKTEVVVFIGNVQIQQPSGSLSGQRVVYNLKSSTIDGGGEGNGRIKMRILPSKKTTPVPAKPTDEAAATEAKGAN